MVGKNVVCLFDVDGTLTKPRQTICEDMKKFLLEKIKPNYTIAVVGGSDLDKISEQMGGMEVLKEIDYVFAENGLVALQKGQEIGRQTIQKYVGEEKLQDFINYCLRYLSDVRLPLKRGTFIEFRTGMINVSPVGRSCSREERNQFEAYDKEHHIRKKFIESIKKEFPDLNLKYSIGGQISFDVFPVGWDKTYCLQYLKDYQEIHFFGDKTDLGGNDYEIFIHERTIGHKVTSPSDTVQQLSELLTL